MTIEGSTPLKNKRYELFCQAYYSTARGKKSAIKAGYKAKTADSRASQLLRILNVKNRIAYLQAKLSKKAGVTAERVVDELSKIGFGRVSKRLSNTEKTKALDLLCKHLGVYERDNTQRQQTVQIVTFGSIHDSK